MRIIVGITCCLAFSPWLCTPAGASAIDVDNPPQGRFADDWLEVFIGQAKIGYGHSTTSREGDLVRAQSTMTIRLGRGTQPIEIALTQGAVETLCGDVVSFSTETQMAAHKTVLSGTVTDGKVTITSSQFGFDRVSVHDFPEGALMTWGMHRESVRRGFKPGTRYTLKMYAPDLRLDGPVTASTVIGDRETFEHRGKRVEAIRVTQEVESPAGTMEIVSWVNNDGDVIKSVLPMPGVGDVHVFITDQQTAMSDFVTPELFMRSAVKVDKPIDFKKANRIKYRLRMENGVEGLADIPATGMQTPNRLGDGSMELVVQRQKHVPVPGAPDPGDIREFLEGNLMINTDDPKLMKLARRAAGEVTEPFALADRLRRFVGDYIQDKSLNIGFASASEVCRNREGDCSEHGVLLAALGRLNGLPSRVVAGLVYTPSFGGQRQLFVYHMWTQFLIDGRWYDFDAAMGESKCSPARIAFAVSSLRSVGSAELSLPLLSKMGAVKLDVLEIE